MKIERLNENQIRCTLTREDLQERGLKLSELAYGTDKAKELFRDMMQQALYLYGFKAENIPLMIEAVPMESGTIVLLVTKVENPEELDARFSSFAPSVQSNAYSEDQAPSVFDQLINAIRGVSPDGEASARDAGSAAGKGDKGDKGPVRNRRGLSPQDVKAYQAFLLTHRMYTFPSISAAAAAARLVAPEYTGESALFLDEEDHVYYLFLQMKDAAEVEAMQPQLAALSEYGSQSLSPYARMEHVREHGKGIIAHNALSILSTL